MSKSILIKGQFAVRTGLCIVLYLPLHLRALGITAAELGVLNLVVRLVSIAVRPAYAMLADKLGRHKLVHSTVYLTGAGLQIFLNAICVHFKASSDP